MREVLSHGPGRILLAFLAACAVAFLAAAWSFHHKVIVFGFMPLPFAVGIAFVALALVAVSLYLFKFWPYR